MKKRINCVFAFLIAAASAVTAFAETPFPEFAAPRCVTSKDKEHLLASYYGINCWSPDKRYLLALRTGLNGRLPETNDIAEVGLIDLKNTNAWIKVSETRCWNFQEAAMGHWLSQDKILFNDTVDGRFSTVILDLKTGKRRSLPYPTAAVSPDGKKIISINYARIRLTRPDYGYAGPGQDAMRNVIYPENDGLWLVDLESGEAKLIVTIASLKDKMHKIRTTEGMAYFCHVVFSKGGKRIFFLGRTIQNFKTWCETVAFTCDADGSNVRVAQDWYSSHFNWKDDDTMAVTAGWHRGPMGHGVFTVGRESEAKRLSPGVLDWDGHCLWTPDGKFLSSDGYWDKRTFKRNWVMIRLEDEAIRRVGQFYVPPQYRHDYWRCDLHPHIRDDGMQYAFNSVHEGSRQIYLMDVLPSKGRTVTKLSGPGWTLDGKSVVVPHSWNIEDAAKGPTGKPRQSGRSVEDPLFLQKKGVYARTIAARNHNRRYFVKCEGASQKATVRVNGVKIGEHHGAYNAFTFEITDSMKSDDVNLLEIEVDNRFDKDLPPTSADFTPFGGLYRDVWLIETPMTCIAPAKDSANGLKIKTDPKTGKVTAEIEIDGHENWSPENPNVYELTVTVRKGDVEDSVTKTFGFRDAEFRKDGFYLNGVKRQMRGVNRHQDVGAQHGWVADYADDERDVKLIKEMGADAVRLCHYPQSERFLDLCDKYGLFVWSEIPLVNTMTDSARFRENVLTATREMVLERMHHPSVFAWGLYNEMSSIPGCMSAAKAAEQLTPARDLMHELDPARPVVAASCQWLGNIKLNYITDILGFNLYPYWYDKKNTMSDLVNGALKNCPFETICVSEYGAGGSVKHHTLPVKENAPSSRFHSEEYQTQIVIDDCRDLFGNPRVWGMFHWCMFDFPSCAREEGDSPGINDKGVMTRERKTKKDAYYFYQANWSSTPVLRLMGQRARKLDAEICDVTGFSNVGDVELFVNGKSLGKRQPDRIKTVVWKGVRFAKGKNAVELKSGELSARAVWALEH